MWLSFGSLTLPTAWLAIIIASLLTTGMLFLLKRKKEADYYSNAILLFILTWKLSVIIFQWSFVVANPMTIIYFDGGIKGYWLGIIVACTYLFVTIRRQMDWATIFQAFLLTMVIYELTIKIVEEISITMKLIFLLVNGSFAIATMLKGREDSWRSQLIILFPIMQILLYSFHDRIFSSPIITYVVASMMLLILSKKKGVTR
ncbi:hypothetical protein [Bacillus sp. FJAT-50079]|uniref:hypothetical protein n=1 Tax=Bacillus sp. FJAT-50079 TaxID=2833577 RepID=UPI001BC9E4AC|nr:hypothetical protein [Bacillus sp. FJAT-50079]MBS4208361.1 hypothetical protein [Bacillus sp. FJAT-50079]